LVSGAGVDATGSVRTLVEPAEVATVACRADAPLVVDWIGGSDVVLREVSLPAAVAARISDVDGRPVVFRARTVIAPMAPDQQAMIELAASRGADAIVVSVNLAWRHWDGESCGGIEPPHSRYQCLLSSMSPAVDAQRDAEFAAMVDAAVASNIPVYVYTVPHSTTAHADPTIEPLIADAEAWVSSHDPEVAHVRLVGRSAGRDIPGLDEGVHFYDMVHPTATGVELLADRLAADLRDFWSVAPPERC
jgi:hypothetical protein